MKYSTIAILLLLINLSSLSFSKTQEILDKTTVIPKCTGQCWLQEKIDPVMDFPIKGVNFQWYRPLLEDSNAMKKVIQDLVQQYKTQKIDGVVALGARGFIFGTPLAMELGVPLVLVRKQGKLPPPVLSQSYKLEYGSATLELETKAILKNRSYLVIDDLIATGGTLLTAIQLVRRAGGKVEHATAIFDLPTLGGSRKIAAQKVSVYTLMQTHLTE